MMLQLTEQYSSDMVLQYVTISRLCPCQEHNHTLEYMDEIKRNQKLMDIAGHEVSPSASHAHHSSYRWRFQGLHHIRRDLCHPTFSRWGFTPSRNSREQVGAALLSNRVS